MVKRLLLFLAVGALLPGCSSLATHRDGELGQVHRVYVEHRLTDNHRIDDLIVGELKARGYEATSGPLTMLPEGVDAVISYQDRWAWDFKNYLIDLSLEMHATYTEKPLATGSYHQAAALTKSPATVVAELITKLFPRR